MQRILRLAAIGVVFAIGPLVSACDSLDTFELFDTKKKLAGDRKPVFPEGVPGVTSGIPAELVKGYREPGADGNDPAKAAAEAAAADAARPRVRSPSQPKPAPSAAKPPPTATASIKPVQRPAAAKPASPPTQAATTTAAAPQSAPPVAPAPPAAAAPLPWPSTQPVAAWPGSPASGTVAR